MHFDFDAYGKVFPPVPAAPAVDTVVETFTPTKDEMAKDNKPGEEKTVEIPKDDPAPKVNAAGEPPKASAEGEPPELNPAGEPPKGEENG